MKSSSDVLKSMNGRKRWRRALERRQRGVPLTLRAYIEMLQPTAQALDEAMCALDLAGHVQFANLRMQRMLGSAESDLVGKSVDDFLDCAFTQPQDAVVSAIAGLREAVAQHVNAEFSACRWRLPNGSSASLRCTLRRIIHEDHTLGMMLVVTAPADQQGEDATLGMERRMRVLDALGDIALAQLPLDDLLQTLLDCLRREMALESAAIFLIDDAGDMVTARTASGEGAMNAIDMQTPLGQDVIGEVINARRTIVVADLSQTPTHSPHIMPALRAHVNVRSLVMVPLIVEQRVIGVLYLGASQPDHFPQASVRLVETVGARAALAIERARANDEAVRAHERLRFLNDASGALNLTLNYHDTCTRLAAILAPELADACAVYLLEDDGLLRKVAMQTPVTGQFRPDPLDVALDRLIGRLAMTIEVNADDADDADDTASAIGRSVHTLTTVFERQPLGENAADETLCLCAPLVVRQHALGALYLAVCPRRTFSDDDLALIQGLAQRAAIAIDNARLYSETQQALASGSAMATQLDTIFNATDVGIFVTDANGAFLRINPYGAQLLGLAESALDRGPHRLGEPIENPFELRTQDGDAIPTEEQPLHLARVQGRAIEQRFVIHRRDTGRDIQALTRCTPWYDARNQIAGAIGVITDITAIYELERQKDEFLGIASHELKTPLTSLKILAQMMTRKMEASGDTRDLEQAKRMQVAITRMQRLIRDLLDVSLIQEGKLALTRELTDLGDICAEVVSEQEMLSQRVIRFINQEPGALPIYADSERIYQVISNLLSNALKYSPATETVVVRSRATADECIISVHDHGPGVPPESQEHIFDRFFRVPGMQVQSGSGVGLGLGLHISKDIVSRHGGRLWVESKLGHGSTFVVALPRAGATAPAPHEG